MVIDVNIFLSFLLAVMSGIFAILLLLIKRSVTDVDTKIQQAHTDIKMANGMAAKAADKVTHHEIVLTRIETTIDHQAELSAEGRKELKRLTGVVTTLATNCAITHGKLPQHPLDEEGT